MCMCMCFTRYDRLDSIVSMCVCFNLHIERTRMMLSDS